MENTCWCTSFCPGYRAMMCSFISISVFQLDRIANVGSDSIRCCSMRATSCEIEYTTTYLITQWMWTLKRVGRIKLSWDVFQNIFYSTIALLFPSTHSSKIYWKVFCLKLLISFELIEKWKDGYAKTCSKLSHSARFSKYIFHFSLLHIIHLHAAIMSSGMDHIILDVHSCFIQEEKKLRWLFFQNKNCAHCKPCGENIKCWIENYKFTPPSSMRSKVNKPEKRKKCNSIFIFFIVVSRWLCFYDPSRYQRYVQPSWSKASVGTK